MSIHLQHDQTNQAHEVPDEWFAPKEQKTSEVHAIKRPSLSYWADTWRRLKQNKLAMFSLSVLIFLFLMAVLGPLLAPNSVTEQRLSMQNLPPSVKPLVWNR